LIHLANFLLVGLLLINLTGLALFTWRLTGSWLLARAASPVLVAVPFFLEHFAGFGTLVWLWPFTTAASVWAMVHDRELFQKHWQIELVYFGAFGYGLCWRYSFPDITPASEKITDLTFIANYMPGVRLPPPDRWLPPFPFDMYYAMQHYGAALLGRTLGATAGQAYNLAFCVIIAASVTAVAGTAWLLARRRFAVVLLVGAFLFGGSGVAPFTRHVMPAHSIQLHSSTRFIGSSLSPELATEPFGRWLLRVNHVSAASLDLPIEMFSYLIGLGDYHPPLGGYLLLLLALLAIALIEAQEAVGPAYALLGATVPLTLACNAWDFPIQALLVGAYVGYRVLERQPVRWKMLLAGGAAAGMLLQPFLAHFASHAGDLNMALRLVSKSAHTPPILWLLIFYPVLVIIGLHLVSGERSRLSLMFCTFWILLLAASEFLFIDDVYVGKYERFNTVLKWWGWIYSGAALLIGSFNLRSSSRICRWGTAAMLLLICSYGRDLAANLIYPAKPHLGQLDGSGWLRDDTANRAVMDFLQSQPPCLVLQRLSDRAYIPEPALVTFAGQIPFMGWANHEDIWRGYRPDVDRRFEQIAAFYSGGLTDSARWLEENGIQYVLWLKDDNQLAKGTYERIDQQIRGRYFWREYYSAGDFRVGFWSLVAGK
jgi:uncharacterized membrane protein